MASSDHTFIASTCADRYLHSQLYSYNTILIQLTAVTHSSLTWPYISKMHPLRWILPALALLTAHLVAADSLPIRIISFNIRYATSSPMTNEKRWWTVLCPFNHDQCRNYHLCSTLGNYAYPVDTAVIGLQEVLSNQLSDVLNNLGSSWAHIGVARDDGATSGEYSPIIYNTNVLRVVYSETKWLSETPDKVSYGWGAGSRRIVTIGVFEHIATGKRFLHANTHLDNVSLQARVEGIKVVVSRIETVQAKYGPLAVTLTGDFNSEPTGTDAYSTLQGLDYVTDMWNTATRLGTNQLTYTGFDDVGNSRIDFIWYGPNDGSYYTVKQTEIVGNKVNGIYISDHRLVYGDLILN